MSIAKITEISSSSTVSFEDAVQQGIARAGKTLKNIKGAFGQPARRPRGAMADARRDAGARPTGLSLDREFESNGAVIGRSERQSLIHVVVKHH